MTRESSERERGKKVKFAVCAIGDGGGQGLSKNKLAADIHMRG